MTAPEAHAAAAQIAVDAIAGITDLREQAEAAVTALDSAGMLYDPAVLERERDRWDTAQAEIADLRTELAALRERVGDIADRIWRASSEGPVLDLVGELRAALGALPVPAAPAVPPGED